MRVFLLLAVVLGSLPVAVFSPFSGLLVYSWLAYMVPQDLAWGVTLPLAKMVAVSMLLGLALAAARRREAVVSWSPLTVLLACLWAWVSLSALLAVSPARASFYYQIFTKTVIVSLATTGLVNSRLRFRLLFGVIALSLGFLGFKFALYGFVRGGARFDAGPGGS